MVMIQAIVVGDIDWDVMRYLGLPLLGLLMPSVSKLVEDYLVSPYLRVFVNYPVADHVESPAHMKHQEP